MTISRLHDAEVPVRFKLAALWTSTMFCYLYGDYFELYVPGKLEDMLKGQMAIGPATQGTLVATALLMALPSVMIVLTLLLPARWSRWLNLATGLFYTGIMLLILAGGAWWFYLLLAAIEVGLTSLVVWYAWRWPRHPAGAA